MPASGASLALVISGKDDGAKKLFDDVATSAGKFATVIAGIGVSAAAGLVGATAAAFKLGESFDAAFDTIRTATGATGEALAGLQDDFKAVAASGPFEFDKVSQAISQLAQRTGEAGPDLQKLADTELRLAGITGDDLGQQIAATTRIFGDWGIATEDQSSTLDKLLRASQSSGVGVSALSEKVVQFGAPLRQLGFTFDQSIAMLSKWEKEGVNVDTVMAGLRKSVATFAKEGIPMNQGLQDTIAKIQKLGPGAEAAGVAMKIFGAKAGPDMAAAILEGKFSYEQLLDAIQNGTDTIDEASHSTEDFAEKWKTFTNKMAVALEPVGTAVFGLAGTLIDELGPALEGMAAAAAPLIASFAAQIPGAIDALKATFADLSASLAPVFQTIADAWGTVVQVFQGDWSPSDTIDPLVNALGIATLAIQAFAAAAGPALGQAFGFLAANGDTIKSVLTGVAAGFAVFSGLSAIVGTITALGSAFATASGAIAASGGIIGAIVAILGGPVTLAIVGIAAAIALLTAAWTGNWGDIQGKTAAAWAVIQPVLAAIGEGLGQIGAAFDSGGLEGALSKLSDLLTGGLNALADLAMQALAPVGEAIGGFFSGLGTTIHDALAGMVGGVVSGLSGLVSGVGAVFSRLGTAVQASMSAAGQLIASGWKAAIATALTLVKAFQVGVATSWATIPADIRADLQLIATTLATRFGETLAAAVAWGQSVLKAIGDAWTSVTTAVATALTDVWTAITAKLGEILTAVGTWASDLVTKFTSWGTEVESRTRTAASNLATPILTAIADILTKVGTWVTDVVAKFTLLASSALTKATEIGTNLAAGITAKTGQVLTDIGTWLTSFGTKIAGGAADVRTKAGEIGQAIVDGIRNTINSGWAALTDLVWQKARELLDTAKRALGVGGGSTTQPTPPSSPNDRGRTVDIPWLRDLTDGPGSLAGPADNFLRTARTIGEGVPIHVAAGIQSQIGVAVGAGREMAGKLIQAIAPSLQGVAVGAGTQFGGKLIQALAPPVELAANVAKAASALEPLAGDRGGLLQQTALASGALTTALGTTDTAFGRLQTPTRQASDIIRELFNATRSLGDYLASHTFDFKINLPELPPWAIPGSPTPFEMGLRGIGAALEDVNRLSAGSFRSLSSPLSAAGAAGGRGPAGDVTIHMGGVTLQGEADEDRLMLKMAQMLRGAMRLSDDAAPAGRTGNV